MTSQHLSTNRTTSASYHEAFSRDRCEPSPLADGSVEIHTHLDLGLKVLVHRVQDPNKTFCVAFQTPHDSANGLPHILEHLVLAGSKEFPVKDPFFATGKGSFKTYLNALTYAEMTLYPVATTNSNELLNLTRIYLDAVFHPLLTDTAFAREGWRVEQNHDGDWIFSGVVYNEMKGAYSDPPSFLYRAACAALYPDTHRGKDSGGDPLHIPTLTRESLVEYHKAHYHPSRAKIVIHGDVSDEDLQALFTLIQEKVAGFERSNFEPHLAKHTTIPTHRHVDLEFPADPQKEAGEPLAMVAWSLGHIADPKERMLWDVVEGVLLNGEAAPLRRRLIERGLTTNLTMSGVMNTLDSMFLVGGTDVSRENPQLFWEGVIEILGEIVDEGISKEAIEAVINEHSFALQEGSLSDPQGVELAESIASEWLRGEDPIALMDQPALLRSVREMLALEPHLLTDLIRDRLLANPERVTVTLRPSHEAYTSVANRERERATQYVEALGEPGLEETRKLHARMTEETDDPEALDRIPALKLSDLPRSLDSFDVVSERSQDGRVYRGTIPSTGIVYTSLAFDLTGLPDRLIEYAPLLAEILGNCDTTRPLVEFEQDVRSRTGGISFAVNTDLHHVANRENILFFAHGAALNERSPDLFRLLGEGLLETTLDQTRVRELLDEMISAGDLHLSRNGHSAALAEAQRAVSEHYHRGSRLGGFSQLAFLRHLRDRIDTDWSHIQADLNQLKAAFVCGNNVRAGLYCAAKGSAVHTTHLESLLSRMPPAVPIAPDKPLVFTPGEEFLGLSVTTDVAYIGAAQKLPIDPDSELLGAMIVLGRAIRYNYLLPEIRGKSGAYGTGVLFRAPTGILNVHTYRSKKENILRDVDTIRGIPDFLRKLEIPASELEKLIIGAASAFAQYDHPRYASRGDLHARLLGRTQEWSELIYQQIVTCTRERLQQAAEIVRNADMSPRIRVVSSESVLREAGIPIRSDDAS